jgi:hypothetical protein
MMEGESQNDKRKDAQADISHQLSEFESFGFLHGFTFTFIVFPPVPAGLN